MAYSQLVALNWMRPEQQLKWPHQDTHAQKLLADVDSGTPIDGGRDHFRSPSCAGEQLTSLGISSSSAPLVLHVNLTSFVFGTALL
jgi:hypothetical protein